MDGILEIGVQATIKFGPFIDDTDGKSAEGAVALTDSNTLIAKNGGAFAAKAETTHPAADAASPGGCYYDVILGTGDTDTLGILKVGAHIAGALPVWQTYQVVTHDAYQSLCGDHVVGAAAVSDIHTDIGTAQTMLTDIHGTDLPAVKADTTAILTDTGTTLDGAVTAIDTVVDGIATEVTQVHAHVAEWVDGARLDLLLDTAAAGGGLDAAAVRTAVGLASANLDTQLTALPTDADVSAACDTAISDAALATATNLATVDGIVDSVLADTNELQTNQGDWATATGFSTFAPATDAVAHVTLVDTTTDLTNGGGGGGLDAAGVRGAIGMATANLDTQLSALPAATDLLTIDELATLAEVGAALVLAGSGGGAIEWTYTLTEADGTPIADAEVWVTTDEAGNNVVASGRTNAFGVVTFYLDAGTYFIWAQKLGTNFDNPDEETVTA